MGEENLVDVTKEKVAETATELQTGSMTGLKAGYKTTEFWMTVASFVLGLLMTLGIIGPEQIDSILSYINKTIGAVFTTIPTIVYIISRGKAKSN